MGVRGMEYLLGACLRLPDLSLPPKEADTWQDPAGHWHQYLAGKYWVWPFLLGTGCLEISLKEVGKALLITAALRPSQASVMDQLCVLGYAGGSTECFGFAREDIWLRGESLRSRSEGLSPGPHSALRSPRTLAGCSPSLALTLPVCKWG